MKVAHLFEGRDKLRELGLGLQSDLLDELDGVVDDIDMTRAIKPRSGVPQHTDGITFKLSGPLVEFYLDLLFYEGNVPEADEWMLIARTGKDAPWDGHMLLNAAGQNGFDKRRWFKGERVVRRINDALAPNSIKQDMVRYNGLWFDKIARNLDKDCKFFFKLAPVVDSTDVISVQLIKYEPDSFNDDPGNPPSANAKVNRRFALAFEQHGSGFRFRLGPLGGSSMRTIEDFSDINEILNEEQE